MDKLKEHLKTKAKEDFEDRFVLQIEELKSKLVGNEREYKQFINELIEKSFELIKESKEVKAYVLENLTFEERLEMSKGEDLY